MAVTEVSSDLILLRISTNTTNGASPRIVVCETDSEATISNSVNETPTKRCGVLRQVASGVFDLTLNGIASATPGTNEVSYKQLSIWAANKTTLWFEYFNLAGGTGITRGNVIAWQGLGYISELGASTTAGENMTFSLSIAFSGNVNTDYTVPLS